jgi:flagellum-specific ATP synthase
MATSYVFQTKKYRNLLASALLYNEAGKISKTQGLIYEAHLPGAAVGSLCEIITDPTLSDSPRIEAEVVGFLEKKVQLMPFDDVPGIHKDSLIVLKSKQSAVTISRAMLGRVIDSRGNPIDGKGPIEHDPVSERKTLYQKPLSPLSRAVIQEPLDLGIRSIDGFITCGKGQRMGIMAGSGVGKSVLLGMISRNTRADINVIALIGERGREVREFIERDLGEEGLSRSIVVVATSDEAPLLRMRGAFLATTIAEYFRDQNQNVLLLMDSLTRFCMAQREIGLSLGEPPASKGYTPSVFALLPKLLERAGISDQGGSVTGLYTVLVEGDDIHDPIADAARSILDGHIVLSRLLAEQNHYPAIDVLQSISRVMNYVVQEDQLKVARKLREWLSLYDQSKDIIEIGAYVRGTNSKLDQAIFVHDRILDLLKQGVSETSGLSQTFAAMSSILRYGEANSAEDRQALLQKQTIERADSARRHPFS